MKSGNKSAQHKKNDPSHDSKAYAARRISNQAEHNDKQSDSIFASSIQEMYGHNVSKQAEDGAKGVLPPHSSQVTLSSIFGNKQIQALAAQNQCATIGVVSNIGSTSPDLKNQQISLTHEGTAQK